MLEEALNLAAQGWRVLPLDGKIPRTPRGHLDATTAPGMIEHWFTQWPDANLGGVPPEDILILDCDPRNGGTPEALEVNLAECVGVESGRRDGGVHLYYQAPPCDLTGRGLPPGVDLKKPGRGYVVLPPSVHPATGLPYRWFRDGDVPKLPTHLFLAVVAPRPPARPPRTGPLDPGPILRKVATAGEGERNSLTYWAACTLIDEGADDKTLENLIDVATSTGLPEREARTVLQSARRKETR